MWEHKYTHRPYTAVDPSTPQRYTRLFATVEEARACAQGGVVKDARTDKVVPVNVGRICASCEAPVTYAPETGRSSWRHTDPTTPEHGWVDPMSQCPTCGERSAVWEVRDTNWGIQSDCAACGYSHYMSIGD
jgi:hypothetical protein